MVILYWKNSFPEVKKIQFKSKSATWVNLNMYNFLLNITFSILDIFCAFIFQKIDLAFWFYLINLPAVYS